MKKERTVTIKALVKKYKFATFYAVPHQNNETRGFFNGISQMPEELRESKYVIKHSDIIPVTHAMTLHFSSEEDRCKYYFFLDVDEIANRLSLAVPGKHIFYIEDVEQEASISVDKDEKMIQAFEILSSNMSSVKLSNILFFMQRDPRNMTENIMKQLVYNEAKTNPDNIIRALDVRGKNQIFVTKLFFHQIIVVKNNMYMYGDVFMGKDIEEAVLFTLNPSNSRITDVLGQQLLQKEGKSDDGDSDAKMEITMPDGEVKEINEDEADALLIKHSLKCSPTYKLKGKIGVLQKNFDLIRE